jgi:murein DD-endopeptidase MepM/ murein hydrolase activator NlpD
VRSGENLTRRPILILLVVFTAISAVSVYLIRGRRATNEVIRQQDQMVKAEDAKAVGQTIVPTEARITAGQTFAAALQKCGLNADDAANASAAAQGVFNLRQLRAGNTFVANRLVGGALQDVEYRIDPDHLLKIVPFEAGFHATIEEIPSRTDVAAISGELEDSLFRAVARAGESPELTIRLAQIFGYDLDFYTDPRKGDTFRVIVEKKKYADGTMAGYGRILAAEYNNAGKKYQALLFHDELGHPAFYSADGKSLQKQFLRSPLRFAAPVTSHFSKARFHPILKTFRAHMGTDYGAPVGTPVQAIGGGRVEFAGRKLGEGNMVEIAHSSGYETMYLHLSRIYVRGGEHIEIGKIIGLVGSTGLSTGPHLDFRILQRGQYKNFEKLGLPPSDPVTRKDWADFTAVREKWLPLLANPDAGPGLGTASPAATAPTSEPSAAQP